MVEKSVTRAVAAKRVNAVARREEAVVAESLTPSILVGNDDPQREAEANLDNEFLTPDGSDRLTKSEAAPAGPMDVLDLDAIILVPKLPKSTPHTLRYTERLNITSTPPDTLQKQSNTKASRDLGLKGGGDPKRRLRGYQGSNFVEGYVNKRHAKSTCYGQQGANAPNYNPQGGSGNPTK
ncbi:hypothetical protein PtA15_4A486 [Puccinia triticina]|uniref:Hyaluronan/mRNA-binding protein domain-containing protein n=1 Tax=Puccinia triticina TaxID=208348 RepID=A0ABY7CJP1_9BASI|nr:uncharacterized protein PtA15_4A486 [Puccinia triticina]WAQ84035.1 hypothetical protein PtA15_4A486 [Puccinia triticina]